MNKIRNMKVVNAVYLTVTTVFIILGLITRSISPITMFGYFLFSGILYVVFTKKFSIFSIVISIYSAIYVIAELPITAYMLTGKDTSFIIVSIPLGYFLVLLISNLVTFAEFSIKSPWVANILGLIALYSVETLLLFSKITDNMLIIGLMGLLTHLLVGFLYLLFGFKSWVHTPKESFEEKGYLGLIKESEEKGSLSPLVDKKGREIKGKFTDSLSDKNNVIKVYPTTDVIYKSNEYKGVNSFRIKNDTFKEKRAYAWLLKFAVESHEKKIKGGREFPILILLQDSVSEPMYTIFEIPQPRSSKVYEVGVLTIDKNQPRPLNEKTLEKLIVDLEVSKSL